MPNEAGPTECKITFLNAESIKAYVKWTYTGYIDSYLSPIDLWKFGDLLGSARFKNEVMHLMFATYCEDYLTAAEISIAYKKTAPGSKLRRFITDYVVTSDVFNVNLGGITTADQEGLGTASRDWMKLVHNGGEFVVDVVLKGGFGQKTTPEEETAVWWSRHKEYLEDESALGSIDGLIAEKVRARKR